ncbi:nucleotidyl transferase AbiEii/AbiGii toxin family protein [Xiamenia xianingshaonis]|uniref:Nucleotidyl transferase AbiEii/AbiGii toxin family protein n=1 Tax=Xiamenia xianingshaonis TaxID=2682776 RepID=A0ABX0IG06_9ACTN|nr:nucleotidyl transferase AbiEii/AbiGii toxin family protein [Xiamenia xianingshaonis]NHM13550.1 hypothetical protein [Xiamenia xianingshaonis]
MKKPNSKRNLDLAIRRLGDGDEAYLRNRAVIANAVVGQMLSGAVIKGGSSLKMRFGDVSTRATTDLDVARSEDMESFSATFARSLADGWEGFTGRLVERPKAAPKNVPPQYVMQPYEVKLSYLGRSWCTVIFEVGHDEIGDADESEYVLPKEASTMLESMGFPKLAPVSLMPLHYQIAQKLHGASEPGSQRAHDLVDLQLIVRYGEVDLSLVRTTCERLFSYRKMQSWPPIVVPNEGWDGAYAEAAESLDVLQSVSEAVQWANCFINEIANY